MSNQLELPMEIEEIREEIIDETREIDVKIPENYNEDDPYTLYTYKSNTLEISNSWSRKSIKRFYQDTYESMVWALNNKCTYHLIDEFGIVIEGNLTIEQYENLPIETVDWIIDSLVAHIDFLVGISVKKKRKR